MTDAIAISKMFIAATKASGLQVTQAFLFGSYAKGRVWEGSDIDICIISSDFNDDYAKIKQDLNRLAVHIDARIEPVIYTPIDFENKYDSLAFEVKQFGIQI